MRLFKQILILFAIAVIVPHVYAEEITSFDQNTVINQDGTIRVTESILYDFGSLNKHGIFRTIPITKTNQDGKLYILALSDISVTDESGTSYQFQKTASDYDLTLKIGDPNRTITGPHTYVIKYSVSGALTYFSDHDELYWNITGDEWNVPIRKAHAVVNVPQGASSDQIRIACYQGPHGSTTNSDCTTSVTGHLAITEASIPLGANEGLTTVVGFPKGVIAVLEPKEMPASEVSPFKTILYIAAFFLYLAWYLILPVAIGIRWWQKGRDPKPTIGEASVWFSPPKDKTKRTLTPGETGTLVDEQADLPDVTATLVHLAQRGYLTFVAEKDNSLELSKNTEPKNDSLLPFEKELYEGVFATGDIVKVKDLTLSTTVTSVKQKLYKAVVADGFFYSNPDLVRTLFTVLGFFGLTTGNIPLLISCVLFGRNMPKKTQLGSDQATMGRSLKQFLSSQEKHLTFQAKEYMMFEKLLPYAVAFGVEKLWAQRFASIDLPQPTWYQGSWTNYNSVVFASSLSSSLRTMQSAMTPTSSSTGHGSGFSGGFSGGGGGGGGGGSW